MRCARDGGRQRAAPFGGVAEATHNGEVLHRFFSAKPAMGKPYAQRSNECFNASVAIGSTVLEQTS
jgi:hypothetical protein